MSPLNARMKPTSLSNNSHTLAGFCGLFDCGKSLVKSNRIIKTRRSARSLVLSALLYRTAYRYLDNAPGAEDAIQDALLSAPKHLDQFVGQARMLTWLVAIVSNCARTQLRRRPRQIQGSLKRAIRE
jgi:predicted RNA polymerase sigma factor